MKAIKKATYFILILAILCCLIFINITKYKPAKKEASNSIKVAFSQITKSTPWTIEMINSFKKSAISNKYDFIYHEPLEYSIDWQIKDVNKLLKQDIDYLILSPGNSKIIPSILKKACNKNIKVILISNYDESLKSKYLSCIHTDYEMEGKLCAKTLAKQYNNTQCNILEIQALKNSSASIMRSSGFKKEISKHPNMKIIKSFYGYNNRLESQKTLEYYISKTTIPINAIFAHNDEDGLGAIQAFKTTGYRKKHPINIVSVNGTQDVLKAIVAGEYTATIESNPRVGDIVIDLIEQNERGFTPTKLIYMTNNLIDSANVHSNLVFTYK